MTIRLLAAAGVLVAVGCVKDKLHADMPRCGTPLPSPLARDLTKHSPVPTPEPPPPPDPRESTAAIPQQPTSGAVVAAVALTADADDKPATKTAPPAPAGPPDGVAALITAARKRVEALTDYEAVLIKREVVGGKALPQDEVLYRFRADPKSVYMRVLSAAGQGREVLYVAGQNGGKMTVVTGKGDSPLVGVGFKTTLDPDSKQATAKSRYKITDAGFGRTVMGLARAAATPGVVKSLGPVARKESAPPLDGLEVTLAVGADPLLPKGGVRRVFFEAKPDAPGYQLPVLVETSDADGREVEYYYFSKLKVPAKLPPETWDPANLGKR